jgi:hypothetical protein
MNQKKKSGLQRGLADIVQKQTAPIDKSAESSSLIARFRESPSPVTDESPIIHASPSPSESPSKLTPVALPDESPSAHASPSVPDSPKPILTPKEAVYRKGDSRINHDFFDDRICGLDPLAQLLYLHLNRYRAAGSNLTVVVSWARLMARIPVSESTLRRAFALLKTAGLAFKERDVYGKGTAQGIIFRVVTGASPITHDSPSTGDTHKTKEVKDNYKREVSDFSACPDCHGTNWTNEVREGRTGVVRCAHANLK